MAVRDQLTFELGDAAAPVNTSTVRLTGTLELDGRSIDLGEPVKVAVYALDGEELARTSGVVSQVSFITHDTPDEWYSERRQTVKLDA